MNTRITFALSIATAILVASCGGKKSSSEDKTVESAETSVVEASYTVDTLSSTVSWKGEVAGVYGHNGEIEVAEGSITTAGDSITGGTIVIDMTTIQPMDSASYKDEEGKRASDLVAHLSTGDFFLVEEHPTSTFVIKSHEGDKLIGDLTVRGTTKEETATLSALQVNEEGLSGSAKLVFNRQDYGVSWEHFMEDMVLSNDITIKIDILAKP